MMALQALTFELRIMARKKRMLLVDHRSGYKRVLTFKLGAQEAKMGQPLAPILGQVQINVAEFVNYFNTKTKDYPKGIKLNVKLFVKWDKTYHIELGKVALSRILALCIYKDTTIDYSQDTDTLENYSCGNYKISYINFFKIVKIYSDMHHIGLDRSCLVVYSQLHLSKVQISEIDNMECSYVLEKMRLLMSYAQVNLELFEL